MLAKVLAHWLITGLPLIIAAPVLAVLLNMPADGFGLLLLALLVLVFAVRIGWSEVTGFSGRFATSSLYYPTVDGWEKVPRSWMMASLLVGFIMLTSVAVELILRQIAVLAGRADDLPVIPETEMVGAE